MKLESFTPSELISERLIQYAQKVQASREILYMSPYDEVDPIASTEMTNAVFFEAGRHITKLNPETNKTALLINNAVVWYFQYLTFDANQQNETLTESDYKKIAIISDLITELYNSAPKKYNHSQLLIADLVLKLTKPKKVNDFYFPLDVVNSKVWSKGLEGSEEPYHLAAENRSDAKSGINIDILFTISFKELEKNITITRKLTEYDERIHDTIGAIVNAGNTCMTLSQIYKNSGYSDGAHPDGNAIERIRESLTKLNKTDIKIDNTQEANRYNYLPCTYTGSLLPCEFVDVKSKDGKLLETYLHVFREPPLLTFAKQRNQCTLIPRKVWALPLNNTDANLKLYTYMLRRIAHAKAAKQPSKILLTTLYENAGIDTKKQRQRAPEKIVKILAHLKDCGYIDDYKLNKEAINLQFIPALPPAKK